MSAASYAAFLAVSLLVICTPGQDTALTIRNTLLGGRRSGVATAAGVSSGQAIWTLATSAGLAVILVASGPLFLAVRLAGNGGFGTSRLAVAFGLCVVFAVLGAASARIAMTVAAFRRTVLEGRRSVTRDASRRRGRATRQSARRLCGRPRRGIRRARRAASCGTGSVAE